MPMNTSDCIIIRSLTVGAPFAALAPSDWVKMDKLYKSAAELIAGTNISIRTKRLVLEVLRADSDIDNIRIGALLRSVKNHAEKYGIRWFCLPIAAKNNWAAEDLRFLGPEFLKENPSLFLNYLFTDDNSYNEGEFRDIARIVLDISRLSNNGFDNFRVGTGFNIIADTPFFPFSWHEGPPCFSFALESLEPLLSILDKHPFRGSWDVVPDYIIDELAAACIKVDSIGIELEKLTDGGFKYKGLDISLAPYPDDRHSLVFLMERLGLGRFGTMGTTSCTAFLTRLLKSAVARSGVRSVGFNGVMFSPLEDKGLAQRLTIDDLLAEHFMLWSTVCGCGIDMLPIEGNTSPGSLAALYRDMFVLSAKHNKPLGVRVLPVPGGRVNEITNFNHDFLTNCRIVNVNGYVCDHMEY